MIPYCRDPISKLPLKAKLRLCHCDAAEDAAGIPLRIRVVCLDRKQYLRESCFVIFCQLHVKWKALLNLREESHAKWLFDNPADEFAACNVMSNLYCITLWEELSQRCILSSRPPSEEAQIKYTFSPNKIGHAVSAPIKCWEKITVNCRAAVYGAANDN